MSTKKSMLPQQKKVVVEENNKKKVDVPEFDYYMNGQFTNKLDINSLANPPVFCYNTIPYMVVKYCVVYIEQNIATNTVINDYISISSGFYLGLIQPGMAMNCMLVYNEPMSADPRIVNVMSDILKFKLVNVAYDNVHKIYESRNLSECFTVLAQIKHKYTSMVNSLIEEFTVNNTDEREYPMYCSVRKLYSDGSITFIPLIKDTLPEDESDNKYRPLMPSPNNNLYDIYNLPEDTKVVFKTNDFNEMTEYINKMGGDE